jgi:hypothetical protein
MWYAIIIIGFMALCLFVAWCLCCMARRSDDNAEEMYRAMRIADHEQYLSDEAKKPSAGKAR